ncbi:MAG: FAD-dependent oxidoreductase [Candidatus Aenigmatarchaeota archaeon]
MHVKNYILGAGFTGLSAGFKTGIKIFEASDKPGGICASYSIDGYKFEVGGGHWIFGADKEVLDFINSFVTTKSYERKSSVYFPDMDLYVPYPLQNHLFYLPDDIRNKALDEIIKSENKEVNRMEEWLEINFGKTLCELFFFPFHELYTAGLYKKIAPQDRFKTPVDKNLILKGAKEKTPPVGYNVTFVYPQEGLDTLAKKIAEKCDIKYNKKVVKINLKNKEIFFEDGSSVRYEKIVSTIPLNQIIEMTGIELGEKPPYTSVLVINIGAIKGEKCPDDHWVYIPRSKTGFHRVGFYSNVDEIFLPEKSRKEKDRVSIYVEMAFVGGTKITEEDIKRISNSTVEELRSWRYIKEVEVVDPTWIEVAYTWEWPNSNWKAKALEVLRANNIYSTGRYGKWKFQGIAESIKDGLGVNV